MVSVNLVGGLSDNGFAIASVSTGAYFGGEFLTAGGINVNRVALYTTPTPTPAPTPAEYSVVILKAMANVGILH